MPGAMRNRQCLAIARTARLGDKHLARTVEILRRQGFRLFHLLGCTLEDHSSATATSTRAYINNIISLGHNVAVVLDNDNRIAGIAQLFQR